MRSTWLTIAGAVFQCAGLALVFVELTIIRSHELGIPPWWAPLRERLDRLLKRPQVIQGGVAREQSRAGHGIVSQRPPPLPDNATDRERLERVEVQLVVYDSERAAMWQAIREQGYATIEEATRRDQEIKDEIARREAAQRAKLRPSIRRQAIGATLVLVGLVLGTTGSLS